MRFLGAHIAIVVLLCCGLPLAAQKEKREPLTAAQIDAIRDASINPGERTGLYLKYLNERFETIKTFSGQGKSASRSRRLDEELQNFTALMDELGSNLDVYSDRHADIRKSLKSLNEALPHWLERLRSLTGEPGFDVARKEAIESGEDLQTQASHLAQEQEEYFRTHKDEQGQERAEPE
jgi:hypothetical protein